MLPNKVKIGAYTYDVIITDEPIILNGETKRARIDFYDLKIYLQAKLCGQRRYQTLFHEIQHGIEDFYQINYAEISEEDIAEIIASAWYQILIDNPEIFNFQIRK